MPYTIQRSWMCYYLIGVPGLKLSAPWVYQALVSVCIAIIMCGNFAGIYYYTAHMMALTKRTHSRALNDNAFTHLLSPDRPLGEFLFSSSSRKYGYCQASFRFL